MQVAQNTRQTGLEKIGPTVYIILKILNIPNTENIKRSK